MFHLATK